MTRMQWGTDPVMASSRAQIRGTAPSPMVRAAVAGNVDMMSSVAVNRMEMMSSSTSPFRSRIWPNRATTRSVMAPGASASTVVAPRTARTDEGISRACYSALPAGPALPLRPVGGRRRAGGGDRHGCRGQRADLVEGERPVGAGCEGRIGEGPDAGPDQTEHGMADGVAHPPDLTVAPLVDDHAQEGGSDH